MSKPDKVRDALIARGVADHVIEGGLERLVKNWESVAVDLESEYWGTFYEWLNEMDGRDILALAMSVASESDLRRFGEHVRVADERVRALSTISAKCIWGSENAVNRGWTAGKQWWYFIVPSAVDRDFAEAIEALD